MLQSLTPCWKHSLHCMFGSAEADVLFLIWLNSPDFWLLPGGKPWASRGCQTTRHGATGSDAAGGPGGASGCDGACDMILNNPTPWQPRQQCCRIGSRTESEELERGSSECIAQCRKQLFFFPYSIRGLCFYTGSWVEAPSITSRLCSSGLDTVTVWRLKTKGIIFLSFFFL